jgi:NADH-quinone oxidoreductase subunit M
VAAVIEPVIHLLLASVAVPLVGAAMGILLWSRPGTLKVWVLTVTGVSLATVASTSAQAGGSAEGTALLYLLPVMAFLSLLGQPVHRDARVAWLMTLLLLGAGLGALVAGGRTGAAFTAGVISLVALMVHRAGNSSGAPYIWAMATFGLGLGSLLVSMAAPTPVSFIALLLGSVTLLPLFPFHGGYVAAVAGLPGNLPAFVMALLPALGFHGLITLLPDMADGIARMVIVLAMIGTLYGSLKALVQCRVVDLLAYAGLAFFSILWWYLALTRASVPQATVYLSAVALAFGGLFLAWRAVQARYGDVDLNAVGGLARPMPRLAAGLSLLVLAAMGLPPFGLFSGFMGMLLDPSFALSGTLVVILAAWLTASWYFLDLMQRILFGRPRSDVLYEDLRGTELASLLVIVMLLLTLGIAPLHGTEGQAPGPGSRTVMEASLWNR